jgi:hypothetical protein
MQSSALGDDRAAEVESAKALVLQRHGNSR